jgi:hypothetical protein
MALEPKINISISSNKCNTINIYEETGAYTTIVTGGWGTPNIDTDNVITANVIIYDHTGDTVLQTIIIKNNTTDLYASVANSTTPLPFLAVEDVDWEQPDGIYQVSYSILDDADDVYNSELCHELFLCNLCNCIKKAETAWVLNCDSLKDKQFKETLDKLELLKLSIESSFACGDFTTALSLLEQATKLCQILSDCGCGCGGC